jgi:quercetin dioxygenase-like cupin family protein
MPFIDTRELKAGEPLPGWLGRYFHSENMTFAYYSIRAGASIHEHSHPNEEVWHVIEGELEVTIGGQTRVAGPGSAAIVPANTPHSVRALTDGRAIVVDWPLRASVGSASTR